jgi:hypothetical protein
MRGSSKSKGLTLFALASLGFIWMGVSAGGCSEDVPDGEVSLGAPSAATPPATMESTAQKAVGESGPATRVKPRAMEEMLRNHFTAMYTIGQRGETAVQASLSALRREPEAVERLTELYAESIAQMRATTDPREHATRGRAAWDIVHTLGELRLPSAQETLERIAEEPLADPKEIRAETYRAEYIVRERAMVGLATLGSPGSVEVLRRIYQRGGPLAAPAALALFELGSPPPGIREVDPATVIPEVDPTDVNVKTKQTRAVIEYPHVQQ